MNGPRSTDSSWHLLKKKIRDCIHEFTLFYFNVWFCIFVFAMHKRLKENFGQGLSRDTLEQYSKREEVDRAHGIKIIVE